MRRYGTRVILANLILATVVLILAPALAFAASSEFVIEGSVDGGNTWTDLEAASLTVLHGTEIELGLVPFSHVDEGEVFHPLGSIEIRIDGEIHGFADVPGSPHYVESDALFVNTAWLYTQPPYGVGVHELEIEFYYESENYIKTVTGYGHFEIVEPIGLASTIRLWGQTAVDTSIAISKEGWARGAPAAVVARDDHFTDALAGGPLAAYLQYAHGSPVPILLTNPTQLTNEARAEIVRLGAKTIYLLGGEGAVSRDVEGSLGRIQGVGSVSRVWGQSAYGTALAIKGEMARVQKTEKGPVLKSAIITTGENFPDALAISGPAAAKNMPILLVKPFASEPPHATKLALQGITDVVIVGGPGAVHPDLEAWLNANGYEVRARLWGISEFETAMDVAAAGDSIFSFDNSTVLVTRGDYFTDALSGGAYSARGPYPMVLVDTNWIPEITRSWLESSTDIIDRALVLGGAGAVSDGVFLQLGREEPHEESCPFCDGPGGRWGTR